MSHFEKIESFKHKLAIETLNNWLKDDYLKTVIEEQFCIRSFIWFVSDIACYSNNRLIRIYEVVKSHHASIYKQWRMYVYFQSHKWDVEVYEIDADWILNKTCKPNYLKTIRIL